MGELTEQHAGSTRLSVEAMAAAPLLFATDWSHSNVQQPMEQVEQWAAAAGGGFQLEAAHDLPKPDKIHPPTPFAQVPHSSRPGS